MAPGLVGEIKRVEDQGGAPRIKFDPAPNNSLGNVIDLGGKEFTFTWDQEVGDLCDIYEERGSVEGGNGLLVGSGFAWRKVNVHRILDESTKNSVKQRSEEAERKNKSRKFPLILPQLARKLLPTLPEQSGALSSPLRTGNSLKSHASAEDIIPFQVIEKDKPDPSSDKEIQIRTNVAARETVGKGNSGANPTDLQSMLIALLMENPKGMRIKKHKKLKRIFVVLHEELRTLQSHTWRTEEGISSFSLTIMETSPFGPKGVTRKLDVENSTRVLLLNSCHAERAFAVLLFPPTQYTP